MNLSTLIIIVVLGLLGIGLVVVLAMIMASSAKKKKVKVASSPSAGQNHPSQPVSTAPAPKDLDREAEAMERAKYIIHGLLMNVSENISSMTQDSTKHTSNLQDYKDNVRNAMSINDLKGLEKTLLKELDSIVAENETYRNQLENANGRIQEQQQSLEKLQTDASMDFLTKIANRRAFDEQYDRMIESVSQGSQPFSMAILDIDHFKHVNDAYGHVVGDKVLRGVAEAIREEIRTVDFLARYGGEEFVVLFPETPLEQGIGIAENVRRRVEKSVFHIDSRTLKVTISLGVSQYYRETDTRGDVLKRADKALYLAKEGGRNRVEVMVPRS